MVSWSFSINKRTNKEKIRKTEKIPGLLIIDSSSEGIYVQVSFTMVIFWLSKFQDYEEKICKKRRKKEKKRKERRVVQKEPLRERR